MTTLTAYKGFYANWKCRDFQYEIGKTFKHKGDVAACESGFHACEHPLNVFSYYAPATSKFAIVELAGKTARESGGDTKIAAAEITIKAEIRLPELIASAVKYVMDRAKWSDEKSNTGDQGAASNTGVRGAASNTGYQGAASNTGYQGAASNTGCWGAASNTGDQGAASNTGVRGAAFSTGIGGKVMGVDGGSLHLDERLDNWDSPDHGKIIATWSGIVGQNGIKADTWYTLRNGKPVEIA